MSSVPQLVFEDPNPNHPQVFTFPPNRHTLGGTAYLILEKTGNILVDCPAWNETNAEFIARQGGVTCLCITHRSAISQTTKIQTALNCQIVVQEQEAYLLPDAEVLPFQTEYAVNEHTLMIWTPGHTPGSACLYHQGTLFTGRHLLPSPKGEIMPIRNRNTFHWPRQLRSVQQLLERFDPDTLRYICPGANLGFLRGKRFIDHAYPRLQDWATQHAGII